ncbi:unnamed protein product [Penicillium bialowiezense]
MASKSCTRCNQVLPMEHFAHESGRETKQCQHCREINHQWHVKAYQQASSSQSPGPAASPTPGMTLGPRLNHTAIVRRHLQSLVVEHVGNDPVRRGAIVDAIYDSENVVFFRESGEPLHGTSLKTMSYRFFIACTHLYTLEFTYSAVYHLHRSTRWQDAVGLNSIVPRSSSWPITRFASGIRRASPPGLQGLYSGVA